MGFVSNVKAKLVRVEEASLNAHTPAALEGVRIVALTPRGKDLIVSTFRKHSGQMKRVFSELSAEELRGLEVALKKVGKRCHGAGGELSGTAPVRALCWTLMPPSLSAM